MPPHCDSVKGPVVTAARKALDERRVDVILPYVKKEGEGEVERAYALAARARTEGPAAREVADRYFFETVVRIHRAGEGAPYTGLRTDGDEGPVIPVAERAIESGDIAPLIDLLTSELRSEATDRFEHLLALRAQAGGVDHARELVEASLGLQVWSHKVHQCITAAAHASPDGDKAEAKEELHVH